jgi:hypothetical protein
VTQQKFAEDLVAVILPGCSDGAPARRQRFFLKKDAKKFLSFGASRFGDKSFLVLFFKKELLALFRRN